MTPPRLIRMCTALAATALVVTGCAATPSTSETDRLVLAQSTSPTAGSGGTIDFTPAACINASWSCQAVYDTLLKVDADTFAVEPWLATGWEYSEGNTVLTFKLRDDVDFSDGTHFTADVVKANLEYYHGTLGMFSKATELNVLDEYTFEMRFSEPSDPIDLVEFDYAVNIVSPAYLEDPEDLPEDPVGSGPYVVDEDATTKPTSYVFRRNPDYWNSEQFPYDEIVIKSLPEATPRLNALIAGEVDVAVIDGATAPEAEKSGLRVVTEDGAWVSLILSNEPDGAVPAMADIRVRRALNMAIDRESIAGQLLGGYSDVRNQPYNPTWNEYRPELEGEYAYDPDEARDLLAEAGFPDGFELTIPSYPLYQLYEPIVTQNLADIGITVTWDRKLDIAEWYNAIIADDSKAYSAILFGTDPLGNENIFLGPGKGFAPYYYRGDDVDAKMRELWNQVREEPFGGDSPARAEIGEYVLDQSQFVVLAQPQVVVAAKPGIEVGTRFDARNPYLSQIRPAE